MLPPYDRLSLICLTLRLEPGLGPEGTQTAVYSAALRVIDRLAETTTSLHPPDTEVFSFDDDHSSLPGIVFVPHLASAEWQSPLGPRSVLGPSIYGQTRLSAPWHLYPTEVIDGAVFGTYGLGRPETWHLSNNPTVMELSRRHGEDSGFPRLHRSTNKLDATVREGIDGATGRPARETPGRFRRHRNHQLSGSTIPRDRAHRTGAGARRNSHGSPDRGGRQ